MIERNMKLWGNIVGSLAGLGTAYGLELPPEGTAALIMGLSAVTTWFAPKNAP